MAVDPTLTDGSGAGMVKSHEVSGDSERTTMRTGKDAREFHQHATNIGMSCDQVDNVFKNVFRYRTKRNSYANTDS